MSHRDDRPTITADELRIPAGHGFQRVPWIGAGIGVASLLVSFALGSSAPEQFFHSWLVAFLFWLSLSLGGLFFVLVHFATKATWSVVPRRMAENVTATFPLFLLLFVPVILGMGHLFHWSHPEALVHDAVLRGKQAYLNTPFFLVRAAVYLISWTALSLFFLRASRRQDETGDIATTLRLIRFSAPALLIFAITVSFAAVDWIMSLDPHWYSTIFGVYYFAGSLVGIFAFLSILGAALRRGGLMTGLLTVEHFHDLGKMLFAFTVFWAYIGFSQYFLIWYANLPEETIWYQHRTHGSWKSVTSLLAWGHFAIPFLFLMSRTVKRRTGLLVLGSLWMLCMHYTDLYWLVMPNFHADGARPSLLDLTTFIGIGGIWIGWVAFQTKSHALLPVRDPRLAESLQFENA